MNAKLKLKSLFLLFALATASAGAASQLPWFQLDAHAKRVLVEKAVAIKPGDSRDSVIAKLGKPTRDERVAPKQSSRVTGRHLSYYAVIQEQDLVNELMDEYVEVVLDERNRVRSVHIRVTLE